VLATALTAAYGIYDYFLTPTSEVGSGVDELRRAEALSFGTNSLGITAAAVLPMALAGLTLPVAAHRRTAALCVALLVGGVAVSGSRTAFVLAVLVALVMAPSIGALRRRVRVLVVCASIGLLVVAVTQQSTAIQRLAQTGTDETVDTRRGSADAAWEAALDNPVFGIGPGRFYEYNREHGIGLALATHNWYLQVIAGVGFGGFLLNAVFLAGCLLRARAAAAFSSVETRRIVRSAALALGFLVLGGFTIDFMSNRAVYIVAGLLCVAPRVWLPEAPGAPGAAGAVAYAAPGRAHPGGP
jgi:O-antigen ligase